MTFVVRSCATACAILLIVRGVSYPLLALSLTQTAKTVEPSRVVWEGVYTNKQAKRGELQYQQQCATCHGASLVGGEASPPLAGDQFLEAWDGRSLGELFETIQVTMPADSPGRLSTQQCADIVAFVLSSNGFPAGDNEIGREAALLKEIPIRRSKP